MSDDLTHDPIELTVEARAHGWRVDHYLTRLYPNYSRALFQRAIAQEAILLNGLPIKASRRLRVNDRLSVKLPELPDESIPPEDIPLNVLYEDDSLIVIDKPAGMIVHPGKGNYRGTMAGALQFHFDDLSDVAGKLRPGIVHRLDKDTSGVLVVAKNNQIHNKLSAQFADRDVTKVYNSIVWGELDFDAGQIDTHLRTHPKQREKMMVCEPGGNSRQAVTFYKTIERFSGFTCVELFPKTGRTHQLRVHMQHLGHPIVADRQYGGHIALLRSELTRETEAGSKTSRRRGKLETIDSSDILISRQALHAHHLEFDHPETGKRMSFTAPLPDDFEQTLNALRELRAKPTAP
ncbi:MAG TPA: RluA family pseudouridine synthase [Planctomycetaceae bacterium]|nr:RluA family pseudouridine synthase [Planctomycetaceae bacterium]